MPYKPELHDAESVLSYYDQYDDAPYTIYAGHKIDETSRRFSYDGDDKIMGRQHLADAMASVMSNPDNTNTYLLVINQKKGRKNEVKNAITFQLNKSVYSQMMPQQMGYANNQLLDEIRSLKSEIAAMKMQQDMMEDDEEEEEPEEENMLAGFMKNPQVQTMILSQLASIFSPQQKVTHVAGVLDGVETEQDSKIDEAIERLKKHDETLGDDLLKLCEIAETDPMQFKMLLKMLRC
jgi:hypothetical protein